jgi:hypothetical protein
VDELDSSSSASLSSSSISSSLSSAGGASAGRGITLLPSRQERYVQGVVDGFRLKVRAVEATLMTNLIFRHVRVEGGLGREVDEFDGVCSSVDLEELPALAPVAGRTPLYRTDEVDLVFRSRAEADTAWQLLVADVTTLVRTLDLMDEMADGSPVRVGAAA